jgi:uncharacterized protein
MANETAAVAGEPGETSTEAAEPAAVVAEPATVAETRPAVAAEPAAVAAEPAAVAETHSAMVFFVGDRAYKVKKPVDLGFLDFRTRSARSAACHREVVLNRRLAPDVYLGVADLVGPGGNVWDHLVVMRRMPAARRLSTLAAAGADLDSELGRLARLVAAFHARAERGPAADRAAGGDALAARGAANTASLLARGPGVVDPDQVQHVDALAARYLAGRAALFDERIRTGRAVDGHGDLLADDIFLLPDGPRVLDCLEFDDDLRRGDALADVAFLAMDLERLGRPDLAGRFLADYREHAADTWPASLAHHHIAYRAQVRSKVAAIRAGQGGDTGTAARDLLALARRHLEAGAVRLVVVGGSPGTGKSTLAAGLAGVLDAAVLRSDEIRKELAGLPTDHPAPAPFGAGIYDRSTTAATYREMFRRAEIALGRGENVVLDASWSDAGRRRAALDLGRQTRSDTVELRCTTPPGLAAARIRRRWAAGGDPSDATPAVAAQLAATQDPWPSATTVDTSGASAQALAAALAAVSGV